MPPMPLDGPFKRSTGASRKHHTILILSRLICVLTAAADLERVRGCYVLNKNTGEVDTFLAP